MTTDQISNEARTFIRDYLNSVMSVSKLTKHELELMNKFDIEICTKCENFQLEEDLDYFKWDKREEEGKCCEDCRNNE